MTTARDEAIKVGSAALVQRWASHYDTQTIADAVDPTALVSEVRCVLDAIPPALLARLAIEAGGLVDDGTWIDPFDDECRIHYEDEDRPEDALTLYRFPIPGEKADQ